ncbi:MAG TPA: tRNA lysidine(34) synthetase TilS [Opitutaceae bacterium]|nr:tRNA lysidine(34) synthetase TilS [Opitutaceae bacterium]
MRLHGKFAGGWPARAERLADLLPRDRLHPTVLAWAQSRRAAARGRWAVAFSGGADSLALLLLLWAHWPERRRHLLALHFNHRLRGRAADADERFCRQVCGALGLRFCAGRWRRKRRGASEEEARAARFAFFDRAMRRACARALWLGHQQNDIAETMLMRLARGSGTAGLAAPRPVQPVAGRVHLRPLLTLRKAAIIAALRAAGGFWREDRSNSGGGFFRNRIRRRVLPAWQKAAGRDAVAGAALARDLLEEDDAALEAWLSALRPLGPRRTLDLARLAHHPRALLRRALRRWLLAQPLAGELSRQGFEDLLTAAATGRPTRRSLGRRGFAVIRGGVLRFKPARSAEGMGQKLG